MMWSERRKSANNSHKYTIMTERMKPLPRDYSSTDGEIPVLRWANRRKMAWWAFHTLIWGTLFYWAGLPLWFKYWGLDPAWLSIIAESYSWIATALTATIVAYMGFNEMPNPFKKGGSFRPSSRPSQSQSSDEEYYEVDTNGKA